MANKSENVKSLKKKEFPLTVVFVRHAQACPRDADKESDPHLTLLGKRQAARVAKRLSNEQFDHIYISKFRRGYDTARLILKYHEGVPFTVTKTLNEVMNFHFIHGAMSTDPHILECVHRERDTLERFANQLRHTHKPGEKILITSHGNFIRSLIPILGELDPKESILIDINNTSVTILEVWPSGNAVLRLANCVKHLLPKQIT